MRMKRGELRRRANTLLTADGFAAAITAGWVRGGGVQANLGHSDLPSPAADALKEGRTTVLPS